MQKKEVLFVNCNGIVHLIVYDEADRIVSESYDGTNTLLFSYAPAGKPLSVIFNGTSYYYIYNLQGDFMGLYDNTGTLVVEDDYDSWGLFTGHNRCF